MRVSRLALILFSCAPVVAAQQPSAAAPQESGMEHKHPGNPEGGFMQGGMHHSVAKGVNLDQKIDSAAHNIVLRIGPMSLPAHTSHMKMPQPEALYWSIPVDGWLLAYHPAMLDASGNSVPGTVLHHVAFWNENRSDFLCPNKDEHIFGAGSELTDWQQMSGFGYPVRKGDRIRIDTMIHNPTATAYTGVYLQITIPYLDEASPAPVKNFYPAWMDVGSCGDSSYDLPPGPSTKSGDAKVKYDGVLLGVGGHLHDYAKQLMLENATRKETVATLEAKTDAEGHLVSVPIMSFYDKGGYKFAAGDELKITATYDNTTGKRLDDGAMGIVVGYFVPADDAALAPLRHEAKYMHMHHPMDSTQPMSHDH